MVLEIFVVFIKFCKLLRFLLASELFNEFLLNHLSDSLTRFGCVLDEAFDGIIWAVLVFIFLLEFRAHIFIGYDKISVFILDLGPLGINASLLEILK